MIPEPPCLGTIKVQENDERGPHQLASMSAHNHTDFILPGDRNPLAILQAISAILLALDMMYNRRRLEAMVHALRNAHLISLVADRHDLVVVPQMVIYYPDNPNEPLSSSLSTEPGKNANSVTPDFCILHLPFHERNPTPGAPFNPTSILDWRRFQLESAFIPIIEEDKRPITRGELTMEKIRTALTQSLQLGCRDAEEYADSLWRDPRRARQKRVILISSVGLWWNFKLAQRPTDEDPVSNAEASNAEEDSDSSNSSVSSDSWVEEGHKPERVEEMVEAEDSDSDDDQELEPQATDNTEEMVDGQDVEDSNLDDDLDFILKSQAADNIELTRNSSLKRKATDNIQGGVIPDDNHNEKRQRTASPMRDAGEVKETQAVPKFRSIDIIDVDPAPNAENDPQFDQIQEVVVDNVQDAWPPIGAWTGLIHMGTPASNQRLWLIHNWLQTFSTDPECVDLDLEDIA